MLTIYKASAGAGKTFALAYEFIKILLGLKDKETGRYVLNSNKYSPTRHRIPCRHSALLAITFTNAATDEMKKRIIGHLDALTGRNPENTSPYTEKLIKEYGCTKEELQQAAMQALSELLYDFNSFNVSTIDSFFQTVLRTFSREIDHQGDYALALDPEEPIRQAIALTLDELNYSQTPQSERMLKWIETVVMDNMSNGTYYNIFNRNGWLLNDFVGTMNRAMNETYYVYSDAIEEYLAEPERIRRFRKGLAEHSNAAILPAVEAAKRLKAFAQNIGADESVFKSIGSRISTCLGDMRFKSDAFKPKAFTDRAEFTVNEFFKNADIKFYGENALAGALPDIELFCTELPKALELQNFFKALIKATDFLEFIGFARRKLEEYLRGDNCVLLADTGELLSRIISDAEMPFIYERMGMKLKNLLIDEFQDTSKMQWHNLKPLFANSLATDNDCLIIGDEKQAIYRFRNSDSEILSSQVTADFPDKHTLRGHKEEDNTNRRSASDIVRFNNALFSTINLDPEHYRNVEQAVAENHKDEPAYIKLRFTELDDMVQTLERTAQDILRQHDAGYRWRDIMILVRTTSDAKETVNYFTTNHPEIELLSSEALLLSSSSSVRAIVSMLKLVSRSYAGKKIAKDSAAPAYASRSEIDMMITRFNHYSSKGLSETDALHMALSENDDAAVQLKNGVDEIRSKNPTNLVALIEAIIALRLTPEMRQKEYAYIAAFQDLAIKHLESSNPSLSAFLDAYDRNEGKWAIQAPADLDAVKVMTIHRSKGLEAACIHLPFADWELCHGRNSLWVPTDGLAEKYGFDPEIVPPALRISVTEKSPLANPTYSPFYQIIADDRQAEIVDTLNLTYVAFTRATRELCAHIRTCRKGINISNVLSEAVDKIYNDGTLPFVLEEVDSDKCYTLGEPTKPEKKSTASDMVRCTEEYNVVFRDNTRELVSIDDIFADDDADGDESEKEIVDTKEPFGGTPEMAEASRRGLNLHAVLASMETQADLDRALGRMAARKTIDDDEAKSYRAELMRAFEAAGGYARMWFDDANKVYAERSFYDAPQGVTLRPDRIVVRPDGTVMIVDYKFTSEARQKHREQVNEYKKIVATLGYENIEAFLWYPLLDKIIKV